MKSTGEKYLTPSYKVCVHVRGGDVSVFKTKRIDKIIQQHCMSLHHEWLSMMMMTIGVCFDQDMIIV